MKSFIVSGRSGSGKSTMLHALEDSGFNCIDNFPASLLVQHVQSELARPADEAADLAVCIDVRNTPEELRALPSYIEQLRQWGEAPRLIYLDASDSVLVKRFSDTRRRHPLDHQFNVLKDAIAYEKLLLEHICEIADLRIDTTNRSLHELDTYTKERIAAQSGNSISLLFQSFGYKNGIPVDTDIVFDARCLPNPYWHEELREFDGRHPKIKDFLDASDVVDGFFADIRAYLDKWVPIFAAQRRVYITVGLGCTGGKHRSVYMVERLAAQFKTEYPDVLVRHRESHELAT
ncbi:MAG: RNase adapter RapZ [Gammaproteobacteria bacterium]|nr:RNase adapter RapZ [Gammaproteobacteria bacterium]